LRFLKKTPLGRAGLSALSDKGFVGPNCDLSNVQVRLSQFEDHIGIDFYGMPTCVYPGDRPYNEMCRLIDEHSGDTEQER